MCVGNHRLVFRDAPRSKICLKRILKVVFWTLQRQKKYCSKELAPFKKIVQGTYLIVLNKCVLRQHLNRQIQRYSDTWSGGLVGLMDEPLYHVVCFLYAKYVPLCVPLERGDSSVL